MRRVPSLVSALGSDHSALGGSQLRRASPSVVVLSGRHARNCACHSCRRAAAEANLRVCTPVAHATLQHVHVHVQLAAAERRKKLEGGGGIRTHIHKRGVSRRMGVPSWYSDARQVGKVYGVSSRIKQGRSTMRGDCCLRLRCEVSICQSFRGDPWLEIGGDEKSCGYSRTGSSN